MHLPKVSAWCTYPNYPVYSQTQTRLNSFLLIHPKEGKSMSEEHYVISPKVSMFVCDSNIFGTYILFGWYLFCFGILSSSLWDLLLILCSRTTLKSNWRNRARKTAGKNWLLAKQTPEPLYYIISLGVLVFHFVFLFLGYIQLCLEVTTDSAFRY